MHRFAALAPPSLAALLGIAAPFTLAAAPILAPDKRAVDNDGPPLERTDLLVYVVAIPNQGADPATAVVFHDPLPAGFESVTVVSIPPGSRDESDLTGPSPFVRISGFDIAAGDTASIVFSGFVAAGAPGPDLCNQGEVTSTEITTPVLTDDASTATPQDPTCLVIDGAIVVLQAEKRVVDANGAPAEAGDTLIYTIDVENIGGADATLAFVSDPIDAAFAAATVIAMPPGAVDRSVLTGSSRRISIEEFAIAAGGRATVVFSATLSSSASGAICNQAYAGSAEVTVPVASDDPASLPPGDPTCLSLPGQASLVLRQTARDENGGGLHTGDRVLFVIEASNPGTAVLTGLAVDSPLPRGFKNLVVKRLPAGAVDRSITGGPTPHFAADGMTVAPGATALLAFEAELAPSASGELCAQASATSIEVPGPLLSDDPHTLEPGDPACLRVGDSPDLQASTVVASKATPLPWIAGDTVTWTIEVQNTGTGSATQVAVVQPIPPGLLAPAVMSMPAGATDSSDLSSPSPFVRIEGFTVASGQSATIEWTATIDAVADATAICGQAALTSAERSASFPSDDPATRAEDDATCLVVGPTLVATTKDLVDLDRGALEPGDLVVWAIDVRNTGSGDALGVAVTDDLPAGISGLAVIAIPPGALDASDLAATPPRVDVSGFTLAAGASERVLVSGVVDLLPPGPELCNQAQVTALTILAPVGSDDASTLASADPTCIALGLAPELVVTKEAVSITGTVPARPGDLVLWLVRIENRGSGPARTVELIDALLDLVEPVVLSLPAGAIDLGDPLATPPLVAVHIPRIEPGSSALVAFLARIAPNPTAAEVCNRALVTARELGVAIASDDPATSNAGDATCLAIDPRPGLPTLSSILPCRGTKKGGTSVTLTGTGFQPGVTVSFDGLPATVVSATATEIVVITPPHPPVGPVDVVVTNPDGTRVSASGGYVYTPPPFPIQLSGKKSGSDAWLIWTGGTGPSVVLRSSDPDFACELTDAFVSTTGTLAAPSKGKNKRVTYFRVE